MKKQAVVVIHGIGEQKPMSTLRGFVDSLSDYSKNEWIEVYNVPDTFSQSYELRQLSLYLKKDPKAKEFELRTDFFEYYWAYHFRGTKLSSVWTWLVQLIWRKPRNIPKRIRWIYFLLWFVLLSYVIILALWGSTFSKAVDWGDVPLIALLSNIGLNAVVFVLTYYMGDAARYTYADPNNIEDRSKIRKGGIDLIERLHESKKYSRIIVVGHSLGSMIGYDVLKHLWAQHYTKYDLSNTTHPRPKLKEYNLKITDNSYLKALDNTDQKQRDQKLAEYMKLQEELLAEQKDRGNTWLISDFITLGSPLAHGQLLMAESFSAFDDRKKERDLPSSPPVKDSKQGISYEHPLGPNRVKLEIIHHSGHFAFTRWHNLYYAKDFVGGPLKDVFGPGIHDKLIESSSFKDNIPFAMHTSYWAEPKKSHSAMQESISYLKEIILTKPLMTP